MDINVTVSDITLESVVTKSMSWDADEGEMVETGDHVRVGDLVAAEIVKKAVADDRYPRLKEQVLEVRKEVIREKVGPMVDEALAGTVRRTNEWGEAKGPEVTFREMVVSEVKSAIGQRHNQHNRGTVLEVAVRAEVQKHVDVAVAEEVAKLSDLVREEVAKGMSETAVAAILASAMKPANS
ncbi:hypothetical protein QFZ75_008051 [Streptomyces sp. V3I8]|uniref:hypothetical protein n=1 Tax=Streptomyces sp. V3I8 TaxID=3042279 RepID=UPI00278656F9|nr:hypothetical protein [Streptomyces sp. V3I8]MDQ1041549.1 hypothetical protein [Streptomyces sp. V3I8]